MQAAVMETDVTSVSIFVPGTELCESEGDELNYETSCDSEGLTAALPYQRCAGVQP